MSPSRNDVRRLLDDIGSADPPPARPGFVAALEDELRRHGPRAETEDNGPVPTRRRWVVPATGAAAAIAVVITLVALLVPDADPDPGRLAVVPPATTTSAAVAPGTRETPVTTGVAPAAPDAPRPRVTVPAATPTTRSTPTTTHSPTTTTTPSNPQTMALRAERDLQGVHLWWSPVSGGEFARYLCLRAEGSNRPTYPTDANTRSVWSTSDQAEDYYIDRAPPGGEASYLMVAVDRNGRELARSNIVSVPALAPATTP